MVSALQPLNIYPGIAVTLSGITIDVRAGQLLNRSEGNDLILLGSVALASNAQSLKAWEPMDVTLSGITTLVNELQ